MPGLGTSRHHGIQTPSHGAPESGKVFLQNGKVAGIEELQPAVLTLV